MLNHNLQTLVICLARSSTLLEYPHSLSYHEMTLWKFEFNEIPAF